MNTFIVLQIVLSFHYTPALELHVQGAGSNFVAALVKSLTTSYMATNIAGNEGIKVSYSSLNSKKGLCRIEDYSAECPSSDKSDPQNLDFAISEVIPKQSMYKAYQDLQMYPIAAGGVSLVYNLPSQNIILTADILAKIYLLNITSWLDSQIVELNPNITLELQNVDPSIKVCGRSDENGASLILSSYLAAAVSEFKSIVGIAPLPSWALGTRLVFGEAEMAAFVAHQIGALGYLGLASAEDYELLIASIQKSDGSVVKPSITSLAYAEAEFAMEFGNNGDDPKHFTANIYYAKSVSAWPIAGYSYLAMRTHTTRIGASCQTRHATVKFWYWFYTSPAAALLTKLYGFVPVSEEARAFLSTQLQMFTYCDGQRAFVQLFPSPIRVGLPSFIYDNLEYVFEGVYKGHSPTSSFIYSLSNQDTLLDSVDVILIKGPPYQSSPLIPPSDMIYFPFSGAAFCFVYNICFESNPDCQAGAPTVPSLTLTGDIIMQILTGVVRYWNDSELVSLNPYFSSIHHAITFVTSNSMIDELSEIKYAFPTVMSSFVFDQSKLNAKIMPSNVHVLLEVTQVPYTIAFLHFSSTIEARALLPKSEDPILISSIARVDGTIVYPSLNAMIPCASDTYNPATNKFTLIASQNKECYPLTQCYRFISRRAYHEAECDFNSAAVQITNFLAWLFTRGPQALTFTSFNMFPLFSTTDQVYRKMKQQLLEITCNGSSLLAKATNYNYISTWATPFAWSLSGVVLFSGVGFALCLLWNRSHKVVRFAQIEFVCMIIAGAILITFSLVPLSHDDLGVDYYSLDDELSLDIKVPRLNSACTLVPWLYVTGFSLEFSALFAKVLRLKKICIARQIKRVRITFKDMLPVLLVVIVCGWLLCALWTGFAPLEWKRFAVTFDASGYMIDSYAHCSSKAFAWFYGAVALFQLACLVYGMVLCYQTRNVQEDFVENKWITIVLINMLTTLVLTVVLGFFMRKNPAALFGIEVINAMMSGFGVMCVMIAPKIYALYNPSVGPDGRRRSDMATTDDLNRVAHQPFLSRCLQNKLSCGLVLQCKCKINIKAKIVRLRKKKVRQILSQ